MLMDPMGGIVMTNDGNAILREVSQRQMIISVMQPVEVRPCFYSTFQISRVIRTEK